MAAGSRLRASLRRGRRPRRPAMQKMVCGQCVGEGGCGGAGFPGGMYAAPTGQPANVCLPGGAVKTAPYKAPVNDSP